MWKIATIYFVDARTTSITGINILLLALVHSYRLTNKSVWELLAFPHEEITANTYQYTQFLL